MLPALFVFHQKSSFSFRFGFCFLTYRGELKTCWWKADHLIQGLSVQCWIFHICVRTVLVAWIEKKLSFVSLASKCLFIFYWFRSGLVVSCSVLFTKQLADDARVTFNVCLFLLCSTTFNAPTYWDLACTKYMIIFEFFSYKKDVLYALN